MPLLPQQPQPHHHHPALQPSGPVHQGLQAAWETAHHDASRLHPVFFSDRLQRGAPFIGDVGVTSPVAQGYRFPETSRLGTSRL